MEKQTSGFKQIYKKPDDANVRAFIGKKEELNTDESLKVEKITTKGDYYSALKERAKNLEEEFGVDFSKLQYSNEILSFINEHDKRLFDYLEATDERPKLSVCCNVVVYLGSCNTHRVIMYVRGSHNIDEILKMSPFSFMEDLEIEERDSFDIKEAKSEWLNDNYNVVAYFEPYEPDFIGIDNKKGAIWQECGDRFQVRLQTKEELIRQYLKQ